MPDVLNELGVYTLSRPKRMALAEQITKLGLSPSDLRQLADYCDSMSSDPVRAQRTLVALVSDPDRLAECVCDLRKRPTIGKPLSPGAIDRRRSAQALDAQRMEWRDADIRHRIRCLIADRRLDGEICEDTGADLTVVAEVRASLL